MECYHVTNSTTLGIEPNETTQAAAAAAAAARRFYELSLHVFIRHLLSDKREKLIADRNVQKGTPHIELSVLRVAVFMQSYNGTLMNEPS